MLSYRHAFHAGNFADVMKHVVLTAVLRYMARKDAKLCYVDTHAGAGAYDLASDYAQKTGEYRAGFARLWQSHDAPAPVADYLELVRKLNPDGELKNYPGSPWFAAQLLKPRDRLVFCEMHGSDLPLLKAQFAGDRRVRCFREDGYQFTAGLLPPPERCGLVFMDPSFELRGEYDTAVTAVTSLYRRFASGSYALWYPSLDGHQAVALKRRFLESGLRDVLHLAFDIAEPGSRAGMLGCGVVLVNPPWTLADAMRVALPYLVDKLASERGAACRVETWADE
jgi:23S rRNA (adenine2030-N6)-methyltransferase